MWVVSKSYTILFLRPTNIGSSLLLHSLVNNQKCIADLQERFSLKFKIEGKKEKHGLDGKEEEQVCLPCVQCCGECKGGWRSWVRCCAERDFNF